MATQRAFDELRPPSAEVIDDCVHCGFCLETCPTYALWNEEMDSPRGRIVLMGEGLEQGSELTPTMVAHFDRCLGCMACVTACPAGVAYDKLIENTRAQVERNFARSRAERLWRAGLFAVFCHPPALRMLGVAGAAAERIGLQNRLRESGLARRFRRLGALLELAPHVPVRKVVSQLPTRFFAQGERRGRIGLLQGCVQRVFFSDTNLATARVLQAEGFEVVAPRRPACCGALRLHTGYDASGQAKDTIAGFSDCDYVVTNAAGCGSALKGYGELLADDPEWGERARAFSAKVRDISEILTEFEPVAYRHPVSMTVCYHDACHLGHAQGVRAQPRSLLRAIPGLELREPAEAELCCGSAGVYNLLQPEAASDLGRRKAQNLIDTRADCVVAANPGCALQIAAKTAELGRPVPVYHPVDLLQMSVQGGFEDG